MKILLTGAGGQLGQAFLEAAPAHGHDVIPAYHAARPDGSAIIARTLDLESEASIRAAVLETRPDWIVHAAAMTNVDACERDPARATTVNGTATGALANAAREVGARMVYVSTDYVFDGERGNYRETDPVNPAQAYGRSKHDGEIAAQRALPDGLIIARTSVVYGPHKKNFVTWLIDELHAGRGVRIVEDQRVSPTLTHDLSEQILALVAADARGVYNTAGATQANRYDMALAIARAFELDAALITPVKSSELNWLAKRPLDSTLDIQKVRAHAQPVTLDHALERLRRDLSL